MKFRKKPVVIEAVQFTEKLALDILRGEERAIFGVFWPSGSYNIENGILYNVYIFISTLEGDMRAELGDWIIKGVNGEFYPCKPDIFEATYEQV